eukprot:4221225-Pleurochrysis_carterae.AAC.6
MQPEKEADEPPLAPATGVPTGARRVPSCKTCSAPSFGKEKKHDVAALQAGGSQTGSCAQITYSA